MGGIFSRNTGAALVLVLLTGCEGDVGERLQSGRVLPWRGLQGRWVGPVVPVDPSCGPEAHGLMSVGDKAFGFDPFQGTMIIHGVVGEDGHLTGRLVRQGSQQQGMSITFDALASSGVPDAETISGKLTSGRCQWTVTLHRG